MNRNLVVTVILLVAAQTLGSCSAQEYASFADTPRIAAIGETSAIPIYSTDGVSSDAANYIACDDGTCGNCSGCCGLRSGNLMTRDRLFGDLFGPKSPLMERGITSDIILGQYYQGVVNGGNEQISEYGGKVDMYFGYGGEKSSMPQGLSLSMHIETRFGKDITDAAGGFTLPNAPLLLPLPGDYNGTNVTGLMLTQSLFDGKADVFFGKLNAIDLVTGLFPFAGGGREGFMNVNGLVSSLPWLRYINLSMWGGGAWTIKKEGIGSGFIFYGTEGVTTDWDFSPSFDDGVGLMLFLRKYYKFRGMQGQLLFVGGGSTKSYASNDPHDWLIIPGTGPISTVRKQPWSTAYYIVQDVWQDPCNEKRKINFLMGGSLADSNPSFSNWNAMGHLEAYGLDPNRLNDRMGISFWYNGLADDFINLTTIAGTPTQDNKGMEIYYNREITPWFHLTGDLQVLENSTVADDTGLVLGLRGIIDF